MSSEVTIEVFIIA